MFTYQMNHQSVTNPLAKRGSWCEEVLQNITFVYSSVEKKHKQFILLLKTDQLEDLGSQGVAMNGTTITEI